MDAFQVPLRRETLGVLAFRRECLAVLHKIRSQACGRAALD
jgi:hypothetical protein